VLVALPPSAITLHVEHPAGSARNVWQGRVGGVEMLTDRIRVAVTGTPDALVDITPAALAELGLQPGDDVWLGAKATETRRYPAPLT
jgi:molybdate transport system ATP-binding protein